MQLIASDTSAELAAMLNGYDYPAILVTADYQILAANQRYIDSFGSIPTHTTARCHQVSHGFSVPCDQAGETCPLQKTLASNERERVLHVHQTPRGPEHVDVELIPIHDLNGKLKFFVELLKPVTLASPQVDRSALVGTSAAFNHLVQQLTRVAPTDAAVLLLGESGTGKELAAQAIHKGSKRNNKAIVTLECSGLTESLFESELFGHVKGAFTGANHNKTGLAEAADGGTLFLDEIGDVPPELQIKLLRLIETGTFRPVGSNDVRRTDFRLLCATHKNLPALVEQGLFRQDLFFRINVFPIRLPALHERQEDIPLLANTILRRLDHGQDYTLTATAMQLLTEHHYRGNVRELRNLLTRATVLANTNVIDQHVIRECLAIDEKPVTAALLKTPRAQTTPITSTTPATPMDLQQNEQHYLQSLLQQCDGDKKQAAKIAGISLRSFYRKLIN
jgi:DNA-binding NtrC family response regulator